MKKLLVLIFITMMSINAFPGDGHHGGGSALDLFENIFHGSANEQVVKIPMITDTDLETIELVNGTEEFFMTQLSEVVSFTLMDGRIITAEDISAIVVDNTIYAFDYTPNQVHNIKKIFLKCGEIVRLLSVDSVEVLIEIESER